MLRINRYDAYIIAVNRGFFELRQRRNGPQSRFIHQRIIRNRIPDQYVIQVLRSIGPPASFHAAMPPWIWQADVIPASCAACTAMAERSP